MDDMLPLWDETDQYLDGQQSTDVATLEPDSVAVESADEWTGPRCEQCDSPIKSDTVAICRSCGWYASLGTYVEVDPDWEAEADANSQPSPDAQPSHLQIWLNLLPWWAWVLIGSAVAVIIESIFARLVTPAGS